jgi:hypothetical protein
LWSNNPSTGDVTIAVHGFDMNAAILYYDYSLDGGMTYTPLYKWPNANALLNSNDGDFTLSFHLPTSAGATFILRNYNLYDLVTSSNVLDLNSQVLSTEYAQGKPITPVANYNTDTTMESTQSDIYIPQGSTVSEADTEVVGDNTAVEEQPQQTQTRRTQRNPVLAVLLLAGMSLIIVMLLVLVIRLFLLEHRKS